MGQGIVECAHHTLKKLAFKDKKGKVIAFKITKGTSCFCLICFEFFCKSMLKVSLQQIATGIQSLPILMPWLNSGTL